MLELFPEGFEERERAAELELVAFTDAAGERRAREAFPHVRAEALASGWEKRWREFHRPTRIGALWVGPPWLEPPSGAIPIVVEPGRAFGTGAHATTRSCLALLLELPRGSLLDVGCGSGVIAVAAARLGFAPVTAIDVDPVAVETTAANASANGVDVDVRLADALTVERLPAVEVAVANIALEPVVALAARVDCAWLVASGYPGSATPELERFRRVERLEADGWAADVFERRSE